MKNLDTYVEELLYKHQCVIIPKFGAFISNRKSAKLFEDKTFSPPKRELTFNSSLISNDGLLVKHISETDNVSYDEAEKYIAQTVEQWKNSLAKSENVNFENIGVLTQTPEGRITFEPFNNLNFLTESFGMSTFVPHEVEGTDKKGDMKVGESVEEKKVQDEKPKEKIKKKLSETQRKSNDMVKYAAVALIGLAVLSYGIYTFIDAANDNAIPAEIVIDDNAVKQEVEQKLSEATFFSEIPVTLPTVALSVNVNEDLKKNEATPATEETKPKAEEKVAENKNTSAEKQAKTPTNESKINKSVANKKYLLIAGSFKDRKNAATRVTQLHKKGYPNATIAGQNKSGLYQVCYDGFDTMDEANALKDKIKSTKNLDGWVLINE